MPNDSRLSLDIRLPSEWSHTEARALIREHYGVEPEEILEGAFSDALRDRERRQEGSIR